MPWRGRRSLLRVCSSEAHFRGRRGRPSGPIDFELEKLGLRSNDRSLGAVVPACVASSSNFGSLSRLYPIISVRLPSLCSGSMSFAYLSNWNPSRFCRHGIHASTPTPRIVSCVNVSVESFKRRTASAEQRSKDTCRGYPVRWTVVE